MHATTYLNLSPLKKKVKLNIYIYKGVHLKKRSSQKSHWYRCILDQHGGEARIDKVKKKIQCFIT